MKEYSGPSQIKLEDVNIEYKCNKNNIKQVINNNKEENTCLDHILIRWKTPYSFNIIKGYYIHLKKIKKIKGKKHETETQYYADSNDLNYNEFILMNRESSFFFLEPNVIYTLHIYGIDDKDLKGPKDRKEKIVFMYDNIKLCKNESCVVDKSENKEKKRIIDFKQDKINSFLEKIIK